MNYSYLLRASPSLPDQLLRLQQVATFAVSALASNNERMGKPFNPMLGETYQLEQDDFRIVSEQVIFKYSSKIFYNQVSTRYVTTPQYQHSMQSLRIRSSCSMEPSTPR